MEEGLLRYATTNTVGLEQMDMFDITNNQETYANFLQKFKQLHTHRDSNKFLHQYQSCVNNEVSFFRATLVQQSIFIRFC